MTRGTKAVLGTGAVCLGLAVSVVAERSPLAAQAGAARPAPAAPAPAQSAPTVPAPVTSTRAAAPAPGDHNQVIAKYCAGCHNDRRPAAGLSLVGFDVTKAADKAEVAEKMIVKLQAGMMPPRGSQKLDPTAHAALIAALEHTLDSHAALAPNPGRRTFQRMNRPEYERAIKDMLGIDVNAGDWLPLDTKSANFDNIADAQALSPTLLESYLNAATSISRMAVGDRTAPTIDTTYTSPSYLSQHPWDYVEGAPYGTRGGIVVNHVFPADAEYEIQLLFKSGENARLEDVDVSIDGERVALLSYELAQVAGADGRGQAPLKTEPIFVRAGQHKVSAAFVRRTEGPYEDLIKPHGWSYAGGGSGGSGITTLPHVRDLVVVGPYRATGVSDTPARQKIFSCRPTSPADERACARQIVTKLGTEAYRRPLTSTEVDRLMPFYEKGAAKAGFEAGVTSALEAILASPYFIFRLEREKEGRPNTTIRVADVDLASRLSFFLWGAPPDKELLDLAAAGRLNDPRVLEAQTRRMLADTRAEALGTRFAAQWLRLQDVDKVHPDPNFYPNFDENLASAMRTETVMFFNSLVREDRSLLDLYKADFTFVNERLAQHYGIPNVAGNQFRRVQYPDASRRGLLGQGAILVQTSLANRTSPVLRGKWVMEVLIGAPPPAPPPNVPTLDDTAGAKDGKMLTTRERMELHRANAVCNACHQMMDPIGLALDNYDVTAQWRVRENGMPLDTRGDYFDGTPVTSPGELVTVMLKRPVPLVRTFTENLLAFALGRRAEYFDQPLIRTIAKNAEKDQYRMSSFILGVVKSDAFRMKRAEPVTETAAPAAER
jgi:mono/diheme cytochrome c family protein